MGRINIRYLFAAISLFIVTYLGSLYFYPSWGTTVSGLVSLAVTIIVGVVALLANWRTITEQKQDPTREIEIDGGTYIEGQLAIEGGDYISGDQIIYEAQKKIFNPLHQLRPPVADFTGREAQLEELNKAVKEQGANITGTLGMGGIGKTELALKLADELKIDYPDAQIMLDLKGASEQEPLTAAEALRHIIHSLEPGVKLPEAVEQLQPHYYTVLEGKRALLLMDNARDKEQVEALTPPTSCLLLVTSRQHFTLPGMHTVDLGRMDEEDAKELLLKIAPRIRERAATIAESCDYLPLAMRLAGTALAETSNLSVDKYLIQLEDAKTRLGFVGASLSLSYDLLDRELARKWRTLTVFQGSFIRPAAQAVWDAEEEQAQEALSALLRHSLLEFNPETQRYRLHDLARDYAFQHLEEEELIESQLRHAGHYQKILTSANSLYSQGGEDVLRGLSIYDLEEDNILAGQAWAAGNSTTIELAKELTNEYPNSGFRILGLRLHPMKYVHWLEQGITAAQQLGSQQHIAWHLGNIGNSYRHLGDIRQSIDYYEQALAIMQEVGDRQGEGAALGSLGLAYANLGEADRAIKLYEEVLKITRETEDRRGEGAALGNLGLAYANQGEVRRAIECHQQYLEIALEIGDRRGEGYALGNLGLGYMELGETQQAIAHFEQSKIIAQEIGDLRSEGIALGNLGLAYRNLGDLRRAIEYYEQQLGISREIGNRRGEGNVLWNTALIKKELGALKEAILLAEESLIIRDEIEDPGTEKVRQALERWRKELED